MNFSRINNIFNSHFPPPSYSMWSVLRPLHVFNVGLELPCLYLQDSEHKIPWTHIRQGIFTKNTPWMLIKTKKTHIEINKLWRAGFKPLFVHCTCQGDIFPQKSGAVLSKQNSIECAYTAISRMDIDFHIYLGKKRLKKGVKSYQSWQWTWNVSQCLFKNHIWERERECAITGRHQGFFYPRH